MVGYYSAPIPVSMAGQHPCLLICDCAEWAVKITEDIVTHQKVILHTRHQILKLLTNTRLGSISNQRRAKWETTLLSKNVDINIDIESAINPASLLPEEGTAHNCARLIETDSQSPLQSEPLSDAMKLFVDGSSFHEQGKGFNGWAVVNEHGETVDCGSLSGGGAQVAELVALTRALQYGQGKRVNVYTDSRYAYGAVHDFGPVWRRRGFLTTAGLPISHQQQVKELMNACDLPATGAVIKVTGHATDNSPEATGNRAADTAARDAATRTETCVSVMALAPQESETPRDIFKLYDEDDPEEIEQWTKLGAQKNAEGLWKCNKRFVCPVSARTELMSLYHGLAHAGPEKLHAMISKTWWWPRLRASCNDFCKRCLVCLNMG
ncbi:uncharacterized protein LOC127662307 isoform X2 [Xyrauchen texanus]|uniref:uncharacterized protein LOC127662307 isoform X2 n=1 Tax=Xyrauchen texanus TaxID=154827 RepID=UPI002241AA28|nr:uncharacterized protein LOC127662307 isoform X2 [Xyrauchen texanus]